jgi:DNA-binding transcriptional ArsR family regulator
MTENNTETIEDAIEEVEEPLEIPMKLAFRALGNDVNLRVIAYLSEGDKYTNDLVLELDVPQPTISKAMKQLKDAGLVSSVKEGVKLKYSLYSDVLMQMAQALGSVAMQHQVSVFNSRVVTLSDLVEDENFIANADETHGEDEELVEVDGLVFESGEPIYLPTKRVDAEAEPVTVVNNYTAPEKKSFLGRLFS